MKKDIIFTNTFDVPSIYEPQPASSYVPEWYRKTENYVGGEKVPNGIGTTSATIKKCIPVFDAITSGYIIVSPTDVFVSQREQEGLVRPYYEWPQWDIIQFHPIVQAPLHPAANGAAYPKWINPWSIKTPKGYSCLFTQPFHRESPFTILDGVVDTDTYTAPVNFPFVLNDVTFSGLIPAGTPIAQVIPFKREQWRLKIGSQEEFTQQMKITTKLRTRFFDSYKVLYWNKKEYK